MGWYQILRRCYHALPEGYVKRVLVGKVYRFLHPSVVKSYTYDKKWCCWKIVTRDGVTLLSLRDFDPAPLSDPELQSLSPGEKVLDLGGNIGMVAIYMAYKVGPTGHVWVYEPDRKNQKLLQKHLELNGVTNVTLVPCGVWNESGNLTFYEGGTYTSSFLKTNYINEDPSRYDVTMVPVVSLDEEYHKYRWEKIDFIKMDIEGSEVQALEGARTLLSELSPTLLIETHQSEGKDTAGVVKEFLTSLGYTLVEKKRERYPTLVAYKSSRRRIS
ncbi:MAG: FkbM family methyltransferase [Brevinematales bacterium]|nr:FkbM family methyltransferase [Brevinematales bacterium]